MSDHSYLLSHNVIHSLFRNQMQAIKRPGDMKLHDVHACAKQLYIFSTMGQNIRLPLGKMQHKQYQGRIWPLIAIFSNLAFFPF